ncbi:MAG: restriction endonuclease subunit S [Kiritimatiellae bacterium]|nr:restriction endonuclease subunit S [Kiritimatiellia bacterium]
MSETLADIASEIHDTYLPNKDEKLPYIGLEHVEKNTLHLCGIGSSQELQSHKFRFKKDDILFGTLRPYFCKLVIAPCNGVCSTEFCVIRAKNPDEQAYVFYSMAQQSFIDYATTNSSGARPRTKWKLFSDFELPALLPAQKRELGCLLVNYDDLIENNRRRIQLLEESARLLYREWFVHLRFPGHASVKVVDGVPEGWEKKPLDELVTLQRGFDLPVGLREEGHVPIYASTGVNGFHSQAKVKGPGVVTGRSGSLGTVMYVSDDFWPLNTALWVKQFKNVPPLFTSYLLRSMNLEQYNGGAAVPTLNRNDVHRVEVLKPAHQLIEEFESICSITYAQLKILAKTNDKLAQARDILLPRLMNGEIEV